MEHDRSANINGARTSPWSSISFQRSLIVDIEPLMAQHRINAASEPQRA
jgi:hypothetical protein